MLNLRCSAVKTLALQLAADHWFEISAKSAHNVEAVVSVRNLRSAIISLCLDVSSHFLSGLRCRLRLSPSMLD